jgi:hypothetical protein
VQEIELVPLLYVQNELPLKFKLLPKFSAKTLMDYHIDKNESVENERERWKAGKAQYAKGYPVRAAVFEAATGIVKAEIRATQMSIQRQFSSKDKVAFLNSQMPLGRAIFVLDQVYASMKEAQERRDEEKSKRWLANYDMAMSRLLADLMFLYEYNYTTGQIRADFLPELSPEHDGWKIGFLPKIGVTEKKAKDFTKERGRLLARIQELYPNTPWAYFAERESRRDVGMVWVAKKK